MQPCAVTRLDRTPNFAERSRVYNPGELWVAYADGDTEAALLEEGAPSRANTLSLLAG